MTDTSNEWTVATFRKNPSGKWSLPGGEPADFLGAIQLETRRDAERCAREAVEWGEADAAEVSGPNEIVDWF
jgi:hypothetical protein